MRVKGTVVQFTSVKGWGWILPDGARKTIFVHVNDIADRLLLRENDRIEFDIEMTPKGERAVRAQLLNEGGAL